MSIRLENWALLSDADGFKAPELVLYRFRGKVYNHPRFNDGSGIVTTAIESYKNGIFVTASGSEYTLGEVNPEYEALYPGALERIIKSIGG